MVTVKLVASVCTSAVHARSPTSPMRRTHSRHTNSVSNRHQGGILAFKAGILDRTASAHKLELVRHAARMRQVAAELIARVLLRSVREYIS